MKLEKWTYSDSAQAIARKMQNAVGDLGYGCLFADTKKGSLTWTTHQ